MNTEKCKREVLVSFLQNRLEEDDRLDFLMHLDSCPNCWEAVYSASKAAHPHYYKRPLKNSRSAKMDLPPMEPRDEEQEEVFEVA